MTDFSGLPRDPMNRRRFLAPALPPAPVTLVATWLPGTPIREVMDGVRNMAIDEALRIARGNKTHAARVLGISIRGLRVILDERQKAKEAGKL
jgi:DNA-binding NtrC family response regulator